ncbi:MAG: transcriptional repressor, partial [Streptococcaceae bacterium]|nr:transcriptional repressor [Streptococcaceae bacterium]
MIPTKLQKLEKELQYKGYKLTKQRKIVIEVLLEKEKEHLSAEEIFDLANKKDSNIGLATIYRTLELFEKLRILDKVNFLKDNTALYDLREKKNQHFHTHLICDKCGN